MGSVIRLKRQVLDNSDSDNWDEAILEWRIGKIEIDNDKQSECYCGQSGIKELNEIVNVYNGQSMFPIGSVCINKFGSIDLSTASNIGVAITKLYNSFIMGERVELKGPKRLFSVKLIDFLYSEGAFSPTESNNNDPQNDHKFLITVYRKRMELNEEEKDRLNSLINKEIKSFVMKYKEEN